MKERDVHPSDELKYEFLITAFAQMEIHLNAVIEFCEHMLADQDDPLLEMQEIDVRLIHTNARYLLDYTDESLH